MRRKRHRVFLCVLLCSAICFSMILYWLNNSNRTRMLRMVDLENASGLKQVDYAYWRDPLKYGHGYEIMTFTVEDVLWSPPGSWSIEAVQDSIDTVANRLGIELNSNAILNLSLGGTDCKSWFFADQRANRPFDEQDFYFAYCDETYENRKVIFVYRGHHLYGL